MIIVIRCKITGHNNKIIKLKEHKIDLTSNFCALTFIKVYGGRKLTVL